MNHIVMHDEEKMVKIIMVTPHVYFRRANLETRRQCNGVYIVGEREVAVVDTPPSGIEMFDEALELFGKPLTTVFLTHAHWDHFEGFPDFINRDINVYCSHRLYEAMDCSMRKSRANVIAVDRLTKFTLASGIEIELESLVDVGHSPCDMLIGIPTLGVLCTGDYVVEFQMVRFHDANIDTWISSLKKLISQSHFQYLLSGHMDIPITSDYLTEFCDHLETIRRVALTLMDSIRIMQMEEISVPRIRVLVEDYFAGGGTDARSIEARSGKENGALEVRMALWQYAVKLIR